MLSYTTFFTGFSCGLIVAWVSYALNPLLTILLALLIIGALLGKLRFLQRKG